MPPENGEDPQDEQVEDRCVIEEQTELDSTNPDALRDLSEGDILPVEVREGVPSLVDEDDRVVGTITGDIGEVLVECIESEHSYRARIAEIDGRRCTVLVENRCFLHSRATLASPNPERLSEVSVGEVFSVEIQDGSLCVVNSQNERVGSLAKPWSNIIKGCVESGWEYEAEVTSIDGGVCEVDVRNNPSK
ncbi:hypothetical protein [Halobacterium sp. KA-6]|uniref:hypothetical protein n=1 Tax=Halobacterium sp. KA-6 TaxID=2896368 RepID=UPI001E3C97A3|nr:hypothetical protein [Halobacterium sp. KA-6]MCD2204539.1 hypothetical protein [Halobacterium sp. KA-6]